MRPLLGCLALLAAGCGDEESASPPPPAAEPRVEAPPPPVAQPRAEAPRAEAPDTTDAAGEDARAVLRRYYALIEAGDLEAAWAMRSGDRAGFERFRATFAGYESYRANVGVPSEPVASGGWLYVEVPVMITGRERGGAPVGTAGSVSMRRAAPDSASASPGQRVWHIFTG